MLRASFFAVALFVASAASAQESHNIYVPSDPQGAEPLRTTQDPGWWQRTFVGWDANGDGVYTGGERGILPMAWDSIMGIVMKLADTVLSMVWAVIPANLKPDTAPLLSYIRIANVWLPLDFMLSLFFLYYTFCGVLVVVKFVLKIIPFIG